MIHDELTILEYSGQILPETSEAVRRYAERWGVSHFNSILETHVMSELQLRDALARALRLAVCEEIEISSGLSVCPEILSYPLARENFWFLLRKTCEGTPVEFHLIASNPLNLKTIKDLPGIVGHHLTIEIAEKSEVVHAIDLHYPLHEQL